MISNYLSVGLFFILVAGFVLSTLLLTHLLGPRRVSANKSESFECGIPSVGNARVPFSVRYFIIAILFVLFDVEVIFFYPWAVAARSLGWVGLGEIASFSVSVCIGFIFIYKKGILDFEKELDHGHPR